MKKNKMVLLATLLTASMMIFAGCADDKSKSDDKKAENVSEASTEEKKEVIETEKSEEIVDGEYSVNVTLEGGSGKATVNSPATVKVKDGKAYATIVWSSKNYDYMIVNGEKYMNENDGGFSTFTFPVDGLDCKMDIIGDTVAMGTPHEIEYVLTFESANIE